MKKLIALFLALMLVFSMSVTAFANSDVPDESQPEETTGSTSTSGKVEDKNGSITIKNLQTAEGVTFRYDIYRILDLQTFNTADKGAYSYVINKDWAGFFADGSEVWNYFTKNESGYILWKNGVPDSDAAKVAALAIAYAKDHDEIKPVKSSANPGEFVVKDGNGTFSELYLGYYLIDSDVGALCGLSTTNPNGAIVAKNGVPTIDKQVKEDSTGVFGEHNTADIGQPMEFMTVINVHAGAQNYVLHDTMTNMTFDKVTSVTLNNVEVKPNEVVDGKTVTNYTVVTPGTCGCTFEVRFDPAFTSKLVTNDKLIVHYTAALSEDAAVGGGVANSDSGNMNETHLEFGEKQITTHETTKTYTYAVELAKTDSQNFLLDGASFKLYDSLTAGNEIPVVKVVDAEGKQIMVDGMPLYRRAPHDQPTGEVIEVTGGLVRIEGLDNGKYYLEEIAAPQGYNKITARQEFTIADGNLEATLSTKDGKQEVTTGSGVQVINKAGTMLPETGAMGTTMFLMFGSFVVLATGVLLVTKKRMSMIEE